MVNKPELKNRNDIAHLVSIFYEKVRKDTTLGPIFNGIITDWDAHLEILTDFWESQLFLKRKYIGDPIKAHQKTDDFMGNTMTMEHFGIWLNLWFATLDELFSGETVWMAKNRARKMNTMLFMKIYEHRNSK